MIWERIARDNHTKIIAGLTSLIYLLHWMYNIGTSLHYMLSGIIHLSFIALIISLIMFDKSEIGYVEKEHISKDIETNVIG